MLLFIKKYALFIIPLLLLFHACSSKRIEGQPENNAGINSSKETLLLNKLSEAAGYKVLSYHQGHFIDSVTVSFACIGEVDSKGIKNVQITFVSLGSDSSFRNIFACKPFEANPGQLEIFTTKLENSSYDCLYFDSGDYYVGTGGGEVYQFIADARQRIVYRTHFVFSKEQRPGVYFYAECKTEEIRKLFLNHLRNDYPEVTILRTDPVF